MTSMEERWAKWDDLRTRQELATTVGEKIDLQREEDALRQEGIKELLSEDMVEPFGWWWLSFADDSGFLGAAIVQGGGMMEAVLQARLFGCNPGGEVMGEPLENLPPPEYRERLLSTEDIEFMRDNVSWEAIT